MDKRQVDLLFWALSLATLIAGGCIVLMTMPRIVKLVEEVEVCIIPPGYLDKPEIIIQERLKTQIIKIYSSTFRKPKINKKEIVGKKSVNSACKEAFELCKRDKGCHAKGCTELSFYKKGLGK